MTPVTFRIEGRGSSAKATCECGSALPWNDAKKAFEASPHLRTAHAFGEVIDFAITSEVICPPMATVTATARS